MSETCRVIINQVKQKPHLVGYLLIRNLIVCVRNPVYKEMWVNIRLFGLRCYPFSLLGGSRIEVGKYCLSIEHSDPENCRSLFIRNTVNHPTIYTCLNLEH